MFVPFTADFVFDKETKGTYRYKEDTLDPPRIGTLYIKKHTFSDTERPNELRVTIAVQYGV